MARGDRKRQLELFVLSDADLARLRAAERWRQDLCRERRDAGKTVVHAVVDEEALVDKLVAAGIASRAELEFDEFAAASEREAVRRRRDAALSVFLNIVLTN